MLQKNFSESITKFNWEGDNLALELDENLQPIRRYVYGVGKDDVEGYVELSEVTGGMFDQYKQGWYSFIKDQVGTIYKVYSDYSQQMVDSRAYDVFGIMVNQNGSSNGNLGFQSKYYDQESELNYFYHRYYNAANGRFMNEDPIRLDGGLNMYSFIKNDPMNTVDHFGLNPISKFIGCVKFMKAVTENTYNASQDDLRHCYASCLIAKHCGGGTLGSAFVGVGKEIWEVFFSGASEFRDLMNNARGNICAKIGIHKSVQNRMRGNCCNVKRGHSLTCCECLKGAGLLK